MAMKSLAEFNRDFITEWGTNKKSQRYAAPVLEETTAAAHPAHEEPPVLEETTAAAHPAHEEPPVLEEITAVAQTAHEEPPVLEEAVAAAQTAPAFNRQPEQRAAKKSAGAFSVVSNIIFYLAIALILVTVLTSGTEYGSPRTIFGYSYFTVMSGSMQDEIPKGAFILVKNIDPMKLNIGDTITYMRDRTTSVTHKIVDIYENYNGIGERGFRTQGVNNSNPDSDVVFDENIVGKVILSLPGVGAMLLYLASNVYIVFIIFGLCVIISFCLRGVFVKPIKKKLQEGV